MCTLITVVLAWDYPPISVFVPLYSNSKRRSIAIVVTQRMTRQIKELVMNSMSQISHPHNISFHAYIPKSFALLPSNSLVMHTHGASSRYNEVCYRISSCRETSQPCQTFRFVTCALCSYVIKADHAPEDDIAQPRRRNCFPSFLSHLQ